MSSAPWIVSVGVASSGRDGSNPSAKPEDPVAAAGEYDPAATTLDQLELATEAHRLKELPARIERLEAEIAKLSQLLSDPELYAREPVKFRKATEALAERQSALAAAEDLLECAFRIEFHRHRRRRVTERDRRTVGATVSAFAGRTAATLLGRQFDRRQRRVLSEMLCRDLVDRRCGVRRVLRLRLDAGEPGRRRNRMHRPVGVRILATGDQRHLVPEGRHRFEYVLELEVATRSFRRPAVDFLAIDRKSVV